MLKKAPGQYVRAYLHAESDGTDMSYFVAHQLDVIIAAVESLRGYLARKTKERNQAEALLRPGPGLGAALNHRQRSLLLHAIRHPGSVSEIAGHQAAHRVTYPNARADLLGLVELNLVEQEQMSKPVVSTPAGETGREACRNRVSQ